MDVDAFSWEQLHADVHAGVGDACAAGASESLIASGVLALARGQELDAAQAPFENAIRGAAWLLMSRICKIDEVALSTLTVSLGLVAAGAAPLSDAFDFARSAEQSRDARLATFDAAARADALYDAGCAFVAENDLLSGLAELSAALRANPKDVQARYNRGQCLWMLEAYEAAMTDWSIAVEIEPKYANGWMRRGLGFLQLGMDEEAESDLVKALELGGAGWEPRETIEQTLADLRDARA